ncbi:membrane protein [Paenibacillus pini]|nr:membrane protein [Paenibacillus pini]
MKNFAKKWILVLMAVTFFFAVSTPQNMDARGRVGGGGFKSPKSSYTNTPKKSTNNDYKKSTNTNTNKVGANGSTAKRGFFSGGGLMRGLMIGGLAGMLFGGLFGNMGFLGNIFGLLINVLAIYVLFSVIRAGYRAYKNRRKPSDSRNDRY